MKRLQALLQKSPGYYKVGASRLSQLVGLKVKTVERYKRSTEYKDGKKNYIESITKKNIDNTASTMVNLITNLTNQA